MRPNQVLTPRPVRPDFFPVSDQSDPLLHAAQARNSGVIPQLLFQPFHSTHSVSCWFCCQNVPRSQPGAPGHGERPSSLTRTMAIRSYSLPPTPFSEVLLMPYEAPRTQPVWPIPSLPSSTPPWHSLCPSHPDSLLQTGLAHSHLRHLCIPCFFQIIFFQIAPPPTPPSGVGSRSPHPLGDVFQTPRVEIAGPPPHSLTPSWP